MCHDVKGSGGTGRLAGGNILFDVFTLNSFLSLQLSKSTHCSGRLIVLSSVVFGEGNGVYL